LEKVLEYAAQSGAGIFAVLFVALLAWVLRTNDNREHRYINIIDKLSDSLAGELKDIKGAVSRIENYLVGGKK